MQKESAIAEQEEAKVAAETEIAQTAADKTEEIKLSCENDLAEALPALKAAAAALNSI